MLIRHEFLRHSERSLHAQTSHFSWRSLSCSRRFRPRRGRCRHLAGREMRQRRVGGQATHPGVCRRPRGMSAPGVGGSCLEIPGDKGEADYRLPANSAPVSLPRKPALFRRTQACFLRRPPPPSRGPRGPKTEVRALPGAGGASQRPGFKPSLPTGRRGSRAGAPKALSAEACLLAPSPFQKGCARGRLQSPPSKGRARLESVSQKERGRLFDCKEKQS